VEKLEALPIKEKRPKDWTAEAQWVALHETHGLEGEALHVWCRENGLFAHHLTSWRTVFCADGKATPCTREVRVLKEDEAVAAGACQSRACSVISLTPRTHCYRTQ